MTKPRKNGMKKGQPRVGGQRKTAQPVVQAVTETDFEEWKSGPDGDPGKKKQ